MKLLLLQCAGAVGMPLPFSRTLEEGMTGSDVCILNAFVQRSLGQPAPVTPDSGSCSFDSDLKAAVTSFQTKHSLSVDGIVGPKSAQAAVDCCALDGYKDSGASAGSLGYKYKVHISVLTNRSSERQGTLYDADNNAIFSFTARLHGRRSDGSETAWPDFGVNDAGLIEFASSGNTITGLTEMDLNSPEGVPKLYGPYNVNRAVKGLEGNSKLMLPHIRDGILIHTGEWPGWSEGQAMPNSNGCIHVWPSTCKRIADELAKLGVEARPNTGGGKDYPYKPQGLLSVDHVDSVVVV
mmetsp:Transcript_30081/g.68106  ORF Transcript_30081/g.68106 Transcript_30081/m.68106 type:complete len:295 (+) Transcript_30081:44-928(+)|eukprot:CAMPEP_0204308472 /NCGR_PEP_ID=MMETSP0469-20131031/532_1 /ASSEMBLY_ACC=CAM_ASM_000384 /TAXON_ID=2969 /ORGANISM="Oxyrrhis marina" /LENGTH=294 /DNA_ID=CAMNT_0051287963 /DNA_START=13 /DNA_END=897 /DNA_ORIENTATION=+